MTFDELWRLNLTQQLGPVDEVHGAKVLAWTASPARTRTS